MSYAFTVVMTVWQRLNMLPRAFFSVLAQTYPDWELVIVADGKHREAEDMIYEFLVRESEYQSRVTYLTTVRAKGAWGNKARRQGLLRARGRYTCFMGHDCILGSTYLAAHAETIAAVDGPVLSIVDVQYWRTRDLADPTRELKLEAYYGVMPRRIRPQEEWAIGDIDLTCVAYPTREAIDHDLFGAAVAWNYTADTEGFVALRAHLPVRYRPGIVAGHF
jgi:glycosyltransferase involved in cell wall biosynthesis